MSSANRQVKLARRPDPGPLTRDVFSIEEGPIPDPGPVSGENRVRIAGPGKCGAGSMRDAPTSSPCQSAALCAAMRRATPPTYRLMLDIRVSEALLPSSDESIDWPCSIVWLGFARGEPMSSSIPVGARETAPDNRSAPLGLPAICDRLARRAGIACSVPAHLAWPEDKHHVEVSNHPDFKPGDQSDYERRFRRKRHTVACSFH